MIKIGKLNRRKWERIYFINHSSVIDAGPRGNLSRFANHSCDPNLRTEKWNISGDLRVGLFATRAIEAGRDNSMNKYNQRIAFRFL